MKQSCDVDREAFPHIEDWSIKSWIIHEFSDGTFVAGSNRAELHLFNGTIVWKQELTFEQAELLCNLIRYYRVNTPEFNLTDLRVLFSGV